MLFPLRIFSHIIRRHFTFFILLLTATTKLYSQLPNYDSSEIHLPLELHSGSPNSSVTHLELVKPKIGLVLSGGGARGIAQIGVLKALEEAQIPIDFIVGTSIGSIVGGLYASGYSIPELESTIRDIDWKSLLSFTDQADREALLIEKKSITDKSIFSIRFDGLSPVLPRAVSDGQRLTNLINLLMLQSKYRPRKSFDELRIPFRAVTTDLYSGKRVILDKGNLAEAIRASATVPVFYSAVSRDSMALVDGGLLSNLPVDVAKENGCDIVIAVNTTSEFRNRTNITNPLQTLDQVLNVMMARSNLEQAQRANFVITPELKEYSSFDFQVIDSLLMRGYRESKKIIPQIQQYIEKKFRDAALYQFPENDSAEVTIDGIEELPSLQVWQSSQHSCREIYVKMTELYESDKYDQVYASVQHAGERKKYIIHTSPRQIINSIQIIGAQVIPRDSLLAELRGEYYSLLSNLTVRSIRERILDMYRTYGYSLASVDSVWYAPRAQELMLLINEGQIGTIHIEGNTRTNPVVILREFRISPGEVFRYDAARDGLKNITALGLFHQVNLEIEYHSNVPDLIIKVEERSSQLMRFGIRVDNERNAQFAIDARDENLFGSGSEFALSFFGGFQNRLYMISYNSNRLFYTNLLFNLKTYWSFIDLNVYHERVGLPSDEFERINIGTYRRIGYGASFTAGTNVERFGNLTATLKAEQQNIRSIKNELGVDEKQFIVSLQFGTLVDSQDRYPFPRNGIKFNAYYESAQTALGSQIPFAKLYFNYEFFTSSAFSHTIHPRIQFGYADKTLPLAEQFNLGGQRSFYGMRENEFFGRQIFSASMEYRYLLPFQVLFDTYFTARYDIGSTWEVPEQIRFRDLRHGAGVSIALDTPIGPSEFSIGKSFLFTRDLPKTKIVLGPTHLYFSIGVGL